MKRMVAFAPVLLLLAGCVAGQPVAAGPSVRDFSFEAARGKVFMPRWQRRRELNLNVAVLEERQRPHALRDGNRCLHSSWTSIACIPG